jgi:hypothetical protein
MWFRILLGATAHAVVLTAIGYGFILAGMKYRSGKPVEVDGLLPLTVVGALAGGFRAWWALRHSSPTTDSRRRTGGHAAPGTSFGEGSASGGPR